MRSNATEAPWQPIWDVFVDSKRRMFTQNFVSDPSDSAAYGIHLTVSNEAGAILYKRKWQGLPAYGNTRLVEDARNRLWLLETAGGNSGIEVRLWRVHESAPLGFTLSGPTDLSAAFAGIGAPEFARVAVPRGGQSVVDAIDAYVNVGPRLVYFRIRLPD